MQLDLNLYMPYVRKLLKEVNDINLWKVARK